MEIIKKICPICVLVSGTWLTLLILKWFGYPVSESFLAMLMGGSVVGVSFTLEKKIKGPVMLWKLLTIPLGFGLMFALISFSWGSFVAQTLAYFLFWFLFRGGPNGEVRKSDSSQGSEINNQLKNCC